MSLKSATRQEKEEKEPEKSTLPCVSPSKQLFNKQWTSNWILEKEQTIWRFTSFLAKAYDIWNSQNHKAPTALKRVQV